MRQKPKSKLPAGFEADVQAVFENVCAHRILLGPRALVSGVSEKQLIARALSQVQAPAAV